MANPGRLSRWVPSDFALLLHVIGQLIRTRNNNDVDLLKVITIAHSCPRKDNKAKRLLHSSNGMEESCDEV